MLEKIIIEAIVVVTIVVIAHFIGLRKARLIDRPTTYDYIIEPPYRKSARIKHAAVLRRQYIRRNRHANVETESLIVLPSISFNWIVGGIAGIVMMAVLCVNHMDGMADHYIIAIATFFTVSVAITGLIAEKIIPDAAMARACKIANNRIKKGRTVRFVQDFSIDELPARARWAYEEEKAKRRKAAN